MLEDLDSSSTAFYVLLITAFYMYLIKDIFNNAVIRNTEILKYVNYFQYSTNEVNLVCTKSLSLLLKPGILETNNFLHSQTRIQHTSLPRRSQISLEFL
jgi:hypothetical protein